MMLKAELTHIVESQLLTGFLQTLLMGQRFGQVSDGHLKRHDYDACPFYIGTTGFKESAFVFTDSGAYADMATVLSLLEQIAI